MKAALGLTLLVAGVYLLTASGHFLGQDQEYYYRMARSIAHEHTFAIEPLVFQGKEIGGARGRDGRFYAQYAPGLPIALAPLVLLGDRIEQKFFGVAGNYPRLPPGDNDVAPRVLVSYFDIPVIAIAAGLLLLLVIRVGYPIGAAIFAGLSFAFSTFAWGQARIIFPEPLQTCILLTAALFLFRATPGRAVIGGTLLGLAILVKITSLLALPAFLLLLNERGETLLRQRSILVALLIPVGISLSAYAWYNWMRFGNLTAMGYSAAYGGTAGSSGKPFRNPLVGLYGLLLSPGRGVIWYAPLIIMAAVSARRFRLDQPACGRAFFVLAGAWIAFHSSLSGWDAGWGWGPRYLLPALPFLLVPLAAAWRCFAGRLACLGLFSIGVIVQIPGTLVDFMAAGQEAIQLFEQSGYQRTRHAFVVWHNFSIAGSEIVRHTSRLLRGQLDLAWLTFGNTWMPVVTFALVTSLISCGLALIIRARVGEVKAA